MTSKATRCLKIAATSCIAALYVASKLSSMRDMHQELVVIGSLVTLAGTVAPMVVLWRQSERLLWQVVAFDGLMVGAAARIFLIYAPGMPFAGPGFVVIGFAVVATAAAFFTWFFSFVSGQGSETRERPERRLGRR